MVGFQPEGWHTITPRIIVRDPENLVSFIKRVFDATGAYRVDRPTEMKIGDSIVMVSGAAERTVMPAFLYIYVADPDTVYQRAIAAGAISLEAPADMFYGDRRAMVRDSWGNIWQLAAHKEDLEGDEIRKRLERGG